MSWIDFIHLNEPTFCKYIDRKNQEMAYFIEEPDYKNFSDAKDFRYIEQKYPYEKMEQDHDLKMRTKFIFAIMKDLLEQNKSLMYTDEMILKQRIDLSLIAEKEVANLCDNMIFRSRYKEFELLYHYGNLDMKTVLKHTRFSPITYLKYIEDLSLNQKGVSGTIIENLNLIYLERVLCSRRLILSDDQQNNLELIRFLRGRTQLPMRLEEEDAKKLDLLFKYGAIHLSRATARKIVEDFSESQVPTITAFSNITSGEAKTLPRCNVFEKGVTQQDISTTTQTPQTKQKTHKPTPKPQKTENKEAEAEVEMDKIFAEAQKNIEMER